MTSKKILLTTFVFLALFAFPSSIEAKKVIPRAAAKMGGTVTKSNAPATTRGITTKVAFRGDRRAIVATFTNLSIASNVSYTLTYEAGGTTQGAGGSILPGSPEPVVRELLFGSCSNGICRYDQGVKNARLVITTTLTSGKKISKTFRLKI